MYTVRVYRDNRQIAAWEQATEPTPHRNAEPLEAGQPRQPREPLEAEDIIACTLVGDDEGAGEAVAMADRIVADLVASGFAVVER